VLLGDVVDELEHRDGLADARAAEEADLAAAAVGASRSMTLMPVSNISTLTDWSTNLGAGRWMGSDFLALTGPFSSTGSPTTLRIRPRTLAAHRHHDRTLRVLDGHAAHEAVGRVHGDAAHAVLAEVLGHLDDEVAGLVADRRVRDAKRRVDLGQIAALEVDVDDGADDLDDASLRGSRDSMLMIVLPLPFQSFRAADDLHQLLRDGRLAARLYLQGQREIISLALLVALSIAVMRAPNSDAIDSSRPR
jgi:hypothetical protein